jgi:hypothetical protein
MVEPDKRAQEQGMRLLLLPMIFCLAASSAAAAPFVPPGVTPPDYVVTMEQTSLYRKASTRVVTRHGEWTRIDSTSGTPPETAYYRHGSNAYVTDNGDS